MTYYAERGTVEVAVPAVYTPEKKVRNSALCFGMNNKSDCAAEKGLGNTMKISYTNRFSLRLRSLGEAGTSAAAVSRGHYCTPLLIISIKLAS